MRRAEVMKYIGERLASERAALDITQEEFAQLLKCSQPQYSRYEKGERPVAAVELYLLAARLQVPIEGFYPTTNRKELDNSERELIEAWRAKDLAAVLQIVGSRFAT